MEHGVGESKKEEENGKAAGEDDSDQATDENAAKPVDESMPMFPVSDSM